MYKEQKRSFQLMKEAFEKAQEDPFFLAHDLEQYRNKNNMTIEDMAIFLGCRDVSSLLKLGLCRAVSRESNGPQKEIATCAQYAKVDPKRLRQILDSDKAE